MAAWLAFVAILLVLGGCWKMRINEERLLAVGGVHALEGIGPCRLERVEPAAALENLEWKSALVVQARGEGTALLVCGGEKQRLRMVAPARLEVVLVGDRVPVGERFQVRAIARDASGRELEVGKWTEVMWQGRGMLVLDSDASAAEFGLCDTCFGVHGFRADAAGTGTIEARLGAATGTLHVVAE